MDLHLLCAVGFNFTERGTTCVDFTQILLMVR